MALNNSRSFVGDLSAGTTVALVSIPEGMAYALVAGVNPVYGLYTGMVTTVVAALTGSTQRLIVTLTNALALVAGEQLVKLSTDDPMRALFTLTFLVGVIMTALGAFRLGSVIRFVSREVMAGFVFATALLIVLGQLKDLVGHESEIDSNKFVKAIDIFSEIGAWDIGTTIVGLSSIVFLLVMKRTGLRRLADILVIVFAAVLVAVFGLDAVEIVGDVSEVPNGLDALPKPMLPDFSMIPVLLGGAVAATVVGLAESSGVGAAFPNTDGRRSDMSRDFLAQGFGNLAGSFFQALPAGGSLSRTGVNASGGAQTRWSGVFAGLAMAGVLFLVGGLAELIPMAGLAALLMVIGVEVMIKEGRALARAWKISRLNTTMALVTILVGVFEDLTAAIFAGVFLSLILHAIAIANRTVIAEIEQDADGQWRDVESPRDFASGQVRVLDLRGDAYFASVYGFDDMLPAPEKLAGVTLIVRIRDRAIQSLTGLEWLEHYGDRISSAGGRLVLADVSPVTERSLAGRIGKSFDVFPSGAGLFAGTQAALQQYGKRAEVVGAHSQADPPPELNGA